MLHAVHQYARLSDDTKHLHEIATHQVVKCLNANHSTKLRYVKATDELKMKCYPQETKGIEVLMRASIVDNWNRPCSEDPHSSISRTSFAITLGFEIPDSNSIK